MPTPSRANPLQRSGVIKLHSQDARKKHITTQQSTAANKEFILASAEGVENH